MDAPTESLVHTGHAIALGDMGECRKDVRKNQHPKDARREVVSTLNTR